MSPVFKHLTKEIHLMPGNAWPGCQRLPFFHSRHYFCNNLRCSGFIQHVVLTGIQEYLQICFVGISGNQQALIRIQGRVHVKCGWQFPSDKPSNVMAEAKWMRLPESLLSKRRDNRAWYLSPVTMTCVDAALIPAFFASRWQKCSHRPTSWSSLRDGWDVSLPSPQFVLCGWAMCVPNDQAKHLRNIRKDRSPAGCTAYPDNCSDRHSKTDCHIALTSCHRTRMNGLQMEIDEIPALWNVPVCWFPLSTAIWCQEKTPHQNEKWSEFHVFSGSLGNYPGKIAPWAFGIIRQFQSLYLQSHSIGYSMKTRFAPSMASVE